MEEKTGKGKSEEKKLQRNTILRTRKTSGTNQEHREHRREGGTGTGTQDESRTAREQTNQHRVRGQHRLTYKLS